MVLYATKVVISALLIVGVTEVSKRAGSIVNTPTDSA